MKFKVNVKELFWAQASFFKQTLKGSCSSGFISRFIKKITFGLAGGLKTLTPHGLLKCAIYTNFECTYIVYPDDNNCITTTQCCTSVKVWVYPNLWSKLCNIETENKMVVLKNVTDIMWLWGTGRANSCFPEPENLLTGKSWKIDHLT